MDATTIIAGLFVIMIFSSLGGGSPQQIRGMRYTEVAVAEIPDPNYLGVVGDDARERIEQFIGNYNKKVSALEATAMADSLMKYGSDYNVNPKLVASLIARESRFNKSAVSSAGAIGLGQLLPQTAEAMKIIDAFDIDQNIKGTTRYVRRLLDAWSGHPQQVVQALSSYLEGPNAINRNSGFTSHTKSYVEDILRIYQRI